MHLTQPPLRAEFHIPETELNNANSDDPTSALLIPADGNANVYSSELADMPGWHSPVLDIDFPARLVPSSTEGHYHLYLDGVAVDWDRYHELLDALGKAGILGKGYVARSIERRQTIVRMPHSRKPAPSC